MSERIEEAGVIGSFAERMFEADCRVESLLWLGGIGDGESVTEEFEKFVEELPEKPTAPLYQALPALSRFCAGDEYPEPQEVAEALILARAGGFLVNAATPVRRYLKGSTTSYYAGWGHYHTGWLYASDESAICAACEAWANEHHAADLAAA